jgi:hypothetical protein
MKIKTYFCDFFENEQSTLYRFKTIEKKYTDLSLQETLAALKEKLKEDRKNNPIKVGVLHTSEKKIIEDKTNEKIKDEITTLEALYNDGWRIKTVFQDCYCKKQTFFMEQEV